MSEKVGGQGQAHPGILTMKVANQRSLSSRGRCILRGWCLEMQRRGFLGEKPELCGMCRLNRDGTEQSPSPGPTRGTKQKGLEVPSWLGIHSPAVNTHGIWSSAAFPSDCNGRVESSRLSAPPKTLPAIVPARREQNNSSPTLYRLRTEPWRSPAAGTLLIPTNDSEILTERNNWA